MRRQRVSAEWWQPHGLSRAKVQKLTCWWIAAAPRFSRCLCCSEREKAAKTELECLYHISKQAAGACVYLDVIFIVCQHKNINKMKQILLVLPHSNPLSILIPKGPNIVAVALLLHWKAGHRMEEGHHCFSAS